ncbi:MAG: nuclear transport factor 2 family protein [Acidobacteria bacterium]|nr:nuclear transport factor 2 family protein [Acidobacteriota bacterium]
MTRTACLVMVGLIFFPWSGRSALAADEGDAVRGLQLKRFQALTRQDYGALQDLLAEDMVYTHSNGRVDSKTSYLQPLLSGATRYEDFALDEVRSRVYGTTAILTGRVRTAARVAGERRTNDLRFIEVWAKTGDGWKMVAWQATRIP